MGNPKFGGLDRLRRLQESKFGTSSSLRPSAVSGPVGQNYRQQQEAYNIATRNARYAARRGDAAAAKDLIDLQDEAGSRGMTTRGIRRRDQFNAAIVERERTLEKAARDNEQTAQVNRMRSREAMGARQPDLAPASTSRPPASGDYRPTDTPPINTGESRFTPPTMSSPTGSNDSGPSGIGAAPLGLTRGSIPSSAPPDLSGGILPRSTPPTTLSSPTGSAPATGGFGAAPSGLTRGSMPSSAPPDLSGGTLPRSTPPTTMADRLAQGRPAPAAQAAPAPRREGMINGKPASYWAEKRDAAETELAASQARGIPKATEVDEQAEYLDAIEGYQKGLVDGGDIDAPLKRANEIYRSSSSLGQAKMVGALLRRASALNKSQAAEQVAKPVPGTTTKVSYYYR